jgi:hypothetical protein
MYLYLLKDTVLEILLYHTRLSAHNLFVDYAVTPQKRGTGEPTIKRNANY